MSLLMLQMMKEKSEKRKLEHRISALSSQMLAGGNLDPNGNRIAGVCASTRGLARQWMDALWAFLVLSWRVCCECDCTRV